MLSLQSVDFAYTSFRRTRRVFEGLTWTVPPGKRTVLLGPNGAGKSTLLKLLAGIIAPSEGAIQIDGRLPGKDKLKQFVSWMPQDVRSVSGLTTEEQIAYAGWLGGRTKTDALAAARNVLRTVLLDSKAKDSVTTLSGGQLRRVGLAEALVLDRSTLLLDEPTAGLDPAQRANFRKILRDLSPRSGILVSTHLLEDVDDAFEHVAVVVEGRIVFDGSRDEFITLGIDGSGDAGAMERAFSTLVQDGLH